MVARIWRGVTAASDGEAYAEYLRQTGVAETGGTAGNRGVLVLRRVVGDRAEFLFVSLWESLDAVAAFAGADVEQAVYYPEDDRFLDSLHPGVEHYEVVDRIA